MRGEAIGLLRRLLRYINPGLCKGRARYHGPRHKSFILKHFADVLHCN